MSEVKNAKCVKEGNNWFAVGEVDGKPVKVPMGHQSGNNCTDKDAEKRLKELHDQLYSKLRITNKVRSEVSQLI